MDTFFSGTTDVALPEGGARRVRTESDRTETDLEARAPYFCERCDESIPLSELAAGRASLVYGLPFCVRCAPLIEEERYQIYFCDRCEVSIPLERIEGGEALAGDGHVYCERCRRRPSRLVRTARRVGLPALVALAVLAVTALAIGASHASRETPPSFEREYERARERLLERLEESSFDRREALRSLLEASEGLEADDRRIRDLEARAEALDRYLPEDDAPERPDPGDR